MKKDYLKTLSGFTIVELLVVIVIISILATITIISYTGISQEARATSLKPDLRNASNQLEMDKVTNDGYPLTEASANESRGLTKSADTIFAYTRNDTGGYCLTARSISNPSVKYYLSNGSDIASGSCPRLWSQISAGAIHTCALTSDSQVYCWGYGGNGTMGDNTGNTAARLTPNAIYTGGVLSGKTIKSVHTPDFGGAHSCVLTTENKAYCWGYNNNGQVGDNTSGADKIAPVTVYESTDLGSKTIKSISLGYNHTCAIASDDKAYCWGLNSSGQLGDSSQINKPAAVAVNTAGVLNNKTIVSISAGYSTTCAIDSDGNLYCWGYVDGQNRLLPVAVNSGGLSGKTVKSVSLGLNDNCVIASDDKAYCWGPNTYGQLGDGTNVDKWSPVAVSTGTLPGDKTVKAISVGSEFACVIASDDNAYCWGRNENEGRLGNNLAPTNSWVPSPVYTTSGILNGKTIKSISSSGHSCVIATGNQGACWGNNNYGQIGDGTSANNRTVPTAILAPPEI